MKHLPTTVTPRETRRLKALATSDKPTGAWLLTKPPAAEIARAIVVELQDRNRDDVMLRLKAGWTKAMRRELNAEIKQCAKRK